MALWTGFPAGTGEMKLDESKDSPKIELRCFARSSDFERKLGTRFVLKTKVCPLFQSRQDNQRSFAPSASCLSGKESGFAPAQSTL